MSAFRAWLEEHEPVLRLAFRVATLAALAAIGSEIATLQRESPSGYAVQQVYEYVKGIANDVGVLREKLAPRY